MAGTTKRTTGMSSYKVSCIMPTANRPNFVALSAECFLNQNFRDVELIIVDDGKQSIRSVLPDHRRIKYFYTNPLGSIGVKRNFACEQATGEIIMHWDDDDWYAYDWISKQIEVLESVDADICGLNEITFFSPLANKYWKYADKNTERPWLSGATMAYRRSFWQEHPFKDIQIGEDYDYIWNTGAKIYAHDYSDGFIATLHNANTTLKPFEDPKHKKHAISWMDVPYKGEAENPKQSRYYN
jgi:glycosyltransferase involved in cell wall biosynthesis